MTSPQSSQHLFSRLKIKSYDFDPNASSATDVGWVDMRDFTHFGVSLFRSVGSNTVTSFAILANSASDGGGTDVTIKTHALGSAPDAVGDQIFLECTAEEIMQEANDAGVTARYVSANIALNTSTDECVVTYIQAGGRFTHDGLTADIIA